MSPALVRSLLLAGCLHGVFAECNVYLETQTMTGPGVCTEDGVAAMTAPEEKQLGECLHECWASYVITSQPAKGANAALAKPERDSCSTNFEIICSTVELSCTKPFGEFPNACSGTVPLAQMQPNAYYLAFYAYSQEAGGGNSEKVLATRVVTGKEPPEICSGTYGVRKAFGDNCFGLTTNSQEAGPGRDPPQPPAIDNMPAQFPPVEPNKEPTTSTSASTSTTDPVPDNGKTVKYGLGDFLPWVAGVCALLLVIGGGLYVRRSRQAEEQRALRTSTEVEIQSVNSLNRF